MYNFFIILTFHLENGLRLRASFANITESQFAHSEEKTKYKSEADDLLDHSRKVFDQPGLHKNYV